MHKQILAISVLFAGALIASGCSTPRIREVDPRVLMTSDPNSVPARASASVLASTNSNRSGPINPASGNTHDVRRSGTGASDNSTANSRAFQPRSVQSDSQQPAGPSINIREPNSQSEGAVVTTKVDSAVVLEPTEIDRLYQALERTMNRSSQHDRSERQVVGPAAAGSSPTSVSREPIGPIARGGDHPPSVEPSSTAVIANQEHADSRHASAATGSESVAKASEVNVGNVRDVDHSEEPDDLNWQARVRRAISALERELEAGKEDLSDDEKSQLNIRLRILNVAVDRRDHALREIKSLSVEQQEYWKHQLRSIMYVLEESGVPLSSKRAALALRELDNAASQLAHKSSLDLKNLAFCSKVDGFGVVTEFAKSEFTPDQEVLLYVEIDRFTSEEMTDQRFGGRNTPRYETELRASYEVLDSNGLRIGEFDLPLDKQSCRSKRRDYFIAYRMHMPRRVDPGSYSLRLAIEDVKGRKFGHGSIEFKIKSSK